MSSEQGPGMAGGFAIGGDAPRGSVQLVAFAIGCAFSRGTHRSCGPTFDMTYLTGEGRVGIRVPLEAAQQIHDEMGRAIVRARSGLIVPTENGGGSHAA